MLFGGKKVGKLDRDLGLKGGLEVIMKGMKMSGRCRT
jgi:hypothetical protein